MANISTARGYFIFENMTPHLIKEFIYFTNTYLGEAYYRTEFDTSIEDEFKEALEYTVMPQTDAAFNGSGRWNYERNLECFVNHLESDINDTDLSRWIDFVNDLVISFKENNSKITVEYDDEESGCGFIYVGSGRFYLEDTPHDITHFESLKDILKYESNGGKDYEHNKRNLIEYCGYSEDEFELNIDDVTDALNITEDDPQYDLKINLIDEYLNDNPFSYACEDQIKEIKELIEEKTSAK
jgi:hypothetical protein